MPIFQAVISASYDATEEAMLVSDLSDYPGNTQTSHLTPEFNAGSYYHIEIQKPDTSTHVWSNQSGGDILIPSVSLDIFDGAHVLLPSDISGDYDVVLTTVPAWNSGETYDVVDNDTVFHSSSFWECANSAVTSEPAIGNPDWTLISTSGLNAKYVDSVTVPVTKSAVTSDDKFETSFKNDLGELGISVSSNCSSVNITDNSNYVNGSPGHSQSDFSDYRFIKMTKPGGQTYIFSSVEFDDIEVDQVISPASSGNHDFSYILDDQIDRDGVWTFQMCNYPTWSDSVTYSDVDFVVVFHNGELYRLLQTSTGNEPGVVGSEDYWELYELLDPEDEYTTRYCTCAKIAILCISTYDCYEQLIAAAFCDIKEDYCNDDLLCKNKTFLNAVKLRVMLDHIEFAVNNEAWNEVEDAFNLIRDICGCHC